MNLKYCSALTQDTDTNAFDAFDKLHIVLQLPCTVHKFNEALGHGFSNIREADENGGITEEIERTLQW